MRKYLGVITATLILPSFAAAELSPLAGFEQEVLPILRQRCYSCHDAKQAEGEIDLASFQTVEEVLADRKLWGKVLKQIKAGAMPPDGRPPLEEAERLAMIPWLEQALIYVDPTQPVDPGRVTVRRLNRIEYNNSIRDLFGVSMKLADEFPEDDVGYGFDNIGDVLSVSPLRMEQYLNAAERLTAALRGGGDKPLFDEFIEAGHLRFQGTPPRNSSDRGRELVPGTELYLAFEIPLPGEYEVLINAWGIERPTEKDKSNNDRWLEAESAEQLDPNALPVIEATLLCDDRVIGHLPVKPGNATTAIHQLYSLRFSTQAGERTLRVRHRFPHAMAVDEVARHLESPLLAPRLGLRQIRVRGPFGRGEAKLSLAHEALVSIRPSESLPARHAAQLILRTIAPRAWRRPLSEQEMERLLGFFERQLVDNASFDRAIDLTVQSLLVSPRFLLLREPEGAANDTSQAGGGDEVAEPLDTYSLASRLSYFLWSSMPDDPLLELARSGQLGRAEVLAAQTERMLEDRRSDAFVEAFTGQWLELRKLAGASFDTTLYPEFSSELKDDLRRETLLFADSLLRENRPVIEFLVADYTFLNGRLAKFYNIEGIDKQSDFHQVSLAGARRRGVLTHGSLLMLTSYPNRTSPTRRGNWILEAILGEEPPPPPDNVPDLDQTVTATPHLSLREQLEQHRVNPTCVSCHRTMDAIGFGLENYDAIGRWRDVDKDRPIDATGDLPSGEKFQSPQELIEILARRETDFVRHLSSKLLTFALGRGMEYYDRTTLDAIVTRTKTEGHRFQDIIQQVVLSRPFRMRRGPGLDQAR